ncbi:MAG: xanthine dehydrogenase family protein molybdopterin-binding subunit [Dehalococcoidia bacterium]|nr:xanthine dehydrogenase family protein molybdopterin-binding subunit [Dehalococcoidia bacterium]
MQAYSVIGKSVPRNDGLDKVTGKTVYSADVHLPGMVHGKILRSPYAHARILRIDTSKAQALDGVRAVVTSQDVPIQGGQKRPSNTRHVVFAQGKALYFGQPVAAVAATTPEVAEAAIALIQVEYEALPVVSDVLDAIKPDAALLHPDLHTEGLAGRDPAPSNIALRVEFNRGDTSAGFEDADVVIEKTFRTQTIHQGYLEPRAAVAEVGSDGRMTVWGSTQGSFIARQLLSEILELPLGKIRVVPMEVGGGFGGKNSLVAAPICAVLAQKARCPVKLVLSRAEDLTSGRPAPGAVVNLKLGATREGHLTAVSGSVMYNSGAFPQLLGADGIITGLGHYRIPNLRFDGYSVVTNRPPVGAFRAPGAPQTTFAMESAMDMLAEALSLDPIELRLRNIVKEGDPMPTDLPFPRLGFMETLKATANHPRYQSKRQGKNVGRGVACGFWMGGVGSSAAHVNLNADGSVALVVGSVDLTGTRTTLAQIAAEALGIPYESVSVVIADTDTAPYSDITAGSRTTHQMGAAVYRACQDAKAQLVQRASARLRADPSEIEMVDGKLRVKSAPEKQVTLAELARASITSSEGAITGRGAIGVPSRIPTFSVHVVDLEVDPETGKTRVLDYLVAQDAGLAVNPDLVQGQMQGAVAQGIGWALSEEYFYDNGIVRNTTLLDYRQPTSLDVPFVSTLIVEVPSPTSVYGIKGIAEAPLVPAMAAIANAINDAVGVRLTVLPMTPESVFRALQAKNSSKA